MQRFRPDCEFHGVFEHQPGAVGDIPEIAVQLFIKRRPHRTAIAETLDAHQRADLPDAVRDALLAVSGELDAAAYAQADADIEWLKAMVSALRRIRSELGVSPAKQVSLLVRGGNADDAARVARFDAQLRFLCKLERIETLAGEPPAAAPAVVGELQLFVPLEGLVDLDAERVRLDKEIVKIAAEKDKSEAKLAKFGAGVPAAVVEQERARLIDWSAKLEALTAQRARLG